MESKWIWTAGRGATAWEAQIGHVAFSIWFNLRYPVYWRTSGLGFIRIVDEREHYD